MINIYEGAEPLLLQHGVNGKDGFVILPTGEDDMDGIYFEDWQTVTAFVRALSKLTSGDPAEVEAYDDWAEPDERRAPGNA